MTADEIRSYLRSNPRLILVSNGANGYPHPMPMNFMLDDEDRIVVTTFRKSQKVLNFQRDKRAALLVESGLDYSELKSVLAYADAEILDDPAFVLETMLAMAKHSENKSMTQGLTDAAREQIRASAPKRLILRFKPHQYVSWDHTKLKGGY